MTNLQYGTIILCMNTNKKINKKEFLRAVKFTLFSISAGVIQIISSFLLKLLILDRIIPADKTIHFIIEQPLETFIAETVGLALSIIWNFTFNRKFTFKAANNVPVAMLLAFVFYVPFYPFQTWYIAAVEKSLANIGEWGFVIAQITVMIINFVLEYLWQTFVVFRKAIDTNAVAQKTQTDETKNLENASAESVNINMKNVYEMKSGKTADITTDELPQKIEVDIVLVNSGTDKIAVIKVLREALNLELFQAKKLAENVPVTIAERMLKDEAKVLADALRKVGATVEIR